jgi:hypothetical protein
MRIEKVCRDRQMRILLAASVIAVSLAPVQATAQERAGDAVLGAVSGGLVLGPIGAAVGGVIGYTAGPSIARSWGLKGSPRPAVRSAKRAKSTAPKKTPVTQSTGTQGASAQGAPGLGPALRPRPSASSAGVRNATPPVQAFE